ncbi:MAG: Gfo/Idh/MocA family oxidoreductase [Anaerolineae bacterium]
MTAPLRIGILSVAHLHAEAYVDNLKHSPGVELIGIADDDTERASRFAASHHVQAYGSVAELLTDQPDGVVICSENSRHAPLVRAAAEAGVHILCEKPLATTLEDAREMVDACARAGAHLMTAFPMRFSPPIRQVKDLLDAGSLGRVYGINGTNQGECPKHLRSWFVDPELAGGGAVMDHTVHLADLLRWMLKSEIIEVYAQHNHILYAEEAPDVETGGLLLLTFADGTFASIDCSWSKPAYYPTWGGLAMDWVAEKGFVRVDAFRQVMPVYTHDAGRARWAFWGSDLNQAMVDEFAASIRENRPPLITGEDGLKALEIVLAAYRSAQAGEPVKLG